MDSRNFVSVSKRLLKPVTVRLVFGLEACIYQSSSCSVDAFNAIPAIFGSTSSSTLLILSLSSRNEKPKSWRKWVKFDENVGLEGPKKV